MSRPLDSVVMEAGLVESLVKDCQRFLSSGAWYRQRGIPHRFVALVFNVSFSLQSSLFNQISVNKKGIKVIFILKLCILFSETDGKYYFSF